MMSGARGCGLGSDDADFEATDRSGFAAHDEGFELVVVGERHAQADLFVDGEALAADDSDAGLGDVEHRDEQRLTIAAAQVELRSVAHAPPVLLALGEVGILVSRQLLKAIDQGRGHV